VRQGTALIVAFLIALFLGGGASVSAFADSTTSQVTASTTFNNGDTFTGTKNLPITLTVPKASGLQAGDKIVVQLPTAGIEMSSVTTNGGAATGSFAIDASAGTVTYTLSTATSALSGDFQIIVNAPTVNEDTSGNTISISTVQSGATTPIVISGGSTFNTAKNSDGGSGNYGGARLIAGVGLYGYSGAGASNYITATGSPQQFLPNQTRMAFNIVIDPGFYMHDDSNGSGDIWETNRVITLIPDGTDASINLSNLYLATPAGFGGDKNNKTYEPLSEIPGVTTSINSSGDAVIEIPDDLDISWTVLGFWITTPNLNDTYGYTATYSSDQISQQTASFGNNVFQTTDSTGFIPQISVDPSSVSLYENTDAPDLLSGVTATDVEDGNLTSAVTVSDTGGFDISKPGTYTVTYSVTDKDKNTVTATRTYTVLADQTAVSAKDVSLYVGQPWSAADGFVSATKADGSAVALSGVAVSGSVDTSTPGTYDVTYTLDNAAGAPVTATSVVTVLADQAAVSAKDVSLYVGQPWSAADGFVSATKADGSAVALSGVAVSGSVDTSTPGTYKVTYSLTNASGVAVSATSTVTVVADQAAVNAHDSSIYTGAAWTAADNFDSAFDSDGSAVAFAKVTVSGSVDTSTPGAYKVTYSFVGSAGATISRTVTVTVLANQAAVSAKDVSLYVGQPWSAADGFVSADGSDGSAVPFSSVTASGTVDTSKAGTYTVTYSFKDSNGATVSAASKVTVLPDKAAVVAKDATVYVGQPWSAADSFVSASDKDGAAVLLSGVTVTGADAVDTSKPGKYPVTYSVTDATGKPVSQTITVTVLAKESPAPGPNVSPTSPATPASPSTVPTGGAASSSAELPRTGSSFAPVAVGAGLLFAGIVALLGVRLRNRRRN
jgi:LPXTG-motif cell wall-anchored protein